MAKPAVTLVDSSPKNKFGIDDKLNMTGSERRAYEEYLENVKDGNDSTSGRNWFQNAIGSSALKRYEDDIQSGKIIFKNGEYVSADDSTPILSTTGGLAGIGTADLLKLRAASEATARKDTELYEKATDRDLVVDGTLSGRQILEELTPILQQENRRTSALDKFEAQGGDRGSIGSDVSTGEINTKTTGLKNQASYDLTTGSPEWARLLENDRRAEAATLAQNELALAQLQGTLATAKMQNEQSVLDREYLDRRDQRDYDYRIKKDDQEQLDKIFALILGGVDKMF